MFSLLQNFHILSSSPDAEVDVKGYNEAFKNSVIHSALANLFAVEVINMIERVIEKYKAQSRRRIGTGAVNTAWSSEKLKHATSLLLHLEGIDITKTDGLGIKNDFLAKVDVWGKEFLPKMRINFFKEKNATPTDGGTLESVFYPMIKDAIEIIFQVYSLYQLQDRTRQDFRVSGEGTDEPFALLWNAQDCAKQAVTALLGDYNPKTLPKSKQILACIKKEHEELSVVTAASNLKSELGDDARPGVNAGRLLHVHKLFTKYLYGSEMKDLKSALESYVVVAKNGFMNTISNAGYYANLAASTGLNFLNKIYETVAPPTQFQEDEVQDEDDDAIYDEAPVEAGPSRPQQPAPVPTQFAAIEIQDDYQATISPVLRAAPSSNRISMSENLIDLSDEPKSGRSTPAPV